MTKTAGMIFLITVVGFTISDGVAKTSSTSDPLKTVRTKFDAFNRHDVDAIRSTYAADAVLHSPDYPELKSGAKIAETYRNLFDAVPDANDSVETLGYFENKVYAQFLLTGHVKGAADKPISVRIMSVYTLRDNLIVEDSTYYDRKTP